MGRTVVSRRRARRRPAVVGFAGLALLTAYAGMSYGSSSRPDIPEATVRSLEAVNRTNGVPGILAYDQSFRDEQSGTLGVEFNRRSWPDNPDAGFYKPHAMGWVCPPGVCPA